MSVLELALKYWDWYLLIGLASACRYVPVRKVENKDRFVLKLLIWDLLTWPSDILRSTKLLGAGP